ncbi:MAG: hypothetical protein KDG44_09790, partial [Burkholderiaceae bacterium]|nr:hypothetical protein [Burkholderiaceae bacterium]
MLQPTLAPAAPGATPGRSRARRALVLAAALWVALALPAQAGDGGPQGAPAPALTFQSRIDSWLRLGYDRPDDALAGLQAMDPGGAATPVERIALLQARGMVLAQSGRAADAQQWIDALAALHESRADAGAMLIRAMLASMQ